MSVDKMPADKIAYSQLSLPAVEKIYSTFSDLFISLEIITCFFEDVKQANGLTGHLLWGLYHKPSLLCQCQIS